MLKTFSMTKQEIEASQVGLRFNEGKPRWSLVPFLALVPMVRVLEYGSKKYSDHNWKRGLFKHEVLECLLRHVFALLEGEDNDKESGQPHIGHILCNAMFYAYFEVFGGWRAKEPEPKPPTIQEKKTLKSVCTSALSIRHTTYMK